MPGRVPERGSVNDSQVAELLSTSKSFILFLQCFETFLTVAENVRVRKGTGWESKDIRPSTNGMPIIVQFFLKTAIVIILKEDCT